MDFFILNEDFVLELNREEILLVKEFEDLFSLKFNSGEKGDKDGRKRLRAFKALKFIHLVYNWRSPYSEFSAKEKHDAAILDSGMEEDLLKDDLIQAAIKKYLDIQDTRIVRLLKSSYRVVDELRHYFDVVDLQERDPVSGKPIFTAKDLMTNLASLAKTVDSLKELEHMVKKEKEQEKALRGDQEPGMFD